MLDVTLSLERLIKVQAGQQGSHMAMMRYEISAS